jgi:hypothetical protein
LAKTARRSNTVHRGLPRLFQSPVQVLLRFREVAFASAFAKASTSVLLVDVPDPATIDEARRPLSSHVNSLNRPGIPGDSNL